MLNCKVSENVVYDMFFEVFGLTPEELHLPRSLLEIGGVFVGPLGEGAGWTTGHLLDGGRERRGMTYRC